MQSHTPFSCNNVYVFKEGGGAHKGEGETERDREKRRGVRSEIIVSHFLCKGIFFLIGGVVKK